MKLTEYDTQTWKQLETASRDVRAAFRFVTLCSVDQQHQPQVRTVVLRATNTKKREIEIHTDIRSQKWREYLQNLNASILGYCEKSQLQLRFQGTVQTYSPETDRAQSAWRTLPPSSRKTYTGGPPGDSIDIDVADSLPGKSDRDIEVEGKQYFGVLSFRAISLDWFQLRRKGNQRAQFHYDESGALVSCHWINP